MSVPALTQADIDSDLRRLRLGRDCLSGLYLAVLGDARVSSPVVSLVEEEGWIGQRVLEVAAVAAAKRGAGPANLAEAIHSLGMGDVSRIAMMAVLQQAFRGPCRPYGWTESDMWSHALFTACANEQIATMLGGSPAQGFLSGLVHGLGRYFISWHCGRWGIRLETAGSVSGQQLREEATRFGMNQCDAAALGLARLGFREPVLSPVRWFWYPQFAAEHASAAERLQAAVELSLIVRSQVGGSKGPWERLNQPQRRVLELTLPRVRRLSRSLPLEDTSTSRPPMLVA